MKVLRISDDAFDFLKRHFASGEDIQLVESELGNRDLAMLDEIATAVTIAEQSGDANARR